MHNYLIELFKEENTVILPKLGALTIVDANTGELMYMSYLRHNDGTLTNYVAKKEHISDIEARRKVEQYVENIIQTIDSGKTFEIQKIGSFHKDAKTKEIQFIYSLNDRKVDVVQQKNPKKENVNPIITEKVQRQTENVKEKPIIEHPKEQNIKETKIAIPQKEIERKINKKQEKKVEQPKRKRSAWVTVVLPILLLLLIGIGIYISLYYEELTQKKPISSKEYAQEKRQQESEIITKTSAEKTENINVDIEKVEPTETTEKFVQHSNDSKVISKALHIDRNMPIQIVVGSFEDEDNADKLIRQLQNKGLYAEKIGTLGSLHLVSAASFQSMAEYRAKQSQLKDFGNYWIKKK